MTAGSGYSAQQYEENYPDGVEQSYWNLARNEVIRRGLGDVGVVLDVGCGRGIVVDYLREHGVDCWGCEVGTPRPITERVAPHLFFGQDATELDSEFAKRVDAVLLLDVLEHLDDPEALLRACRARFSAARRFVVTVPARSELWTNYDDHFGHRRRYDLSSVRELLACLAPSQVAAGYFFHALYPAIRVVAALGRKRTVEVGAPSGRLVRLAHRVLARGFDLDARVLPRWLPGSSILVVAEV